MRPFDPLPVIHSLWTTAGLPLSRLPELILTPPRTRAGLQLPRRRVRPNRNRSVDTRGELSA